MSYDDYITEPPADDTEAAIEEAVEYLDAQTYDARGLHIYHDDATCTYWFSSSEDMATLGRRLIDAPQRCDVYSRWCADTVRDSDIDETTDLEALQAEAGAADDMPTFMALAFLRDEINDTIRINAEITEETAA